MKPERLNMRLLVVEDDDRLAATLTRGLEEEDFAVAWACAGESGCDIALKQTFDCILLDVRLPGLDGINVCRRLRSAGCAAPVIMLTVNSSVEDKVAGLSSGADDYIVKPFSFSELLARINAQIRRQRQYAASKLHYADLELDILNRSLKRKGAGIKLTPKEFELLEYLMRNPERAVSERELIENVWNLKFDPHTNVVNVYLHHLRNKLNCDSEDKLIHTLRGRGYSLGKEKHETVDKT